MRVYIKKNYPLAVTLLLVAWQFYINVPVIGNGFLNAGDNHIHLSIANHLYEILIHENRILGWNSLYGNGTPLFLLRPPGLYIATAFGSLITGLPVEDTMKLLVVLGLSLYPLTMFLGARLLGVTAIEASLISALSPLCISTWGHTLDAYHLLGLYKQLLAILIFPLGIGALWRLIINSSHSLLWIAVFPAIFLIHPYIAFCLVMTLPAMLIALLSSVKLDEVFKRLWWASWWVFPTVALVSWWLIPFASSDEIQQVAPFSYARMRFDVAVCTVFETVRQFFLGGILDTTKWSGAFGNHEWGWRDNGSVFRLPTLTLFCFLGFVVALGELFKKERTPHLINIVLSFLISFILLCGPDDFAFLDLIPFADNFQNIHAIFLFEFFAVLLGGIGINAIFCRIGKCSIRGVRWAIRTVVVIIGATLWFLAARERTITAEILVDRLAVQTIRGELYTSPTLLSRWNDFYPVVEYLRNVEAPGAVATSNYDDMDSMVLDLLPGMAHRPMFLSRLEEHGGVYKLLNDYYRLLLPTNVPLQRLLDIHFSVASSSTYKAPMKWPDSMHRVLRNEHWELYEVTRHDYGHLEVIKNGVFLGFIGTEQQWSELMHYWLEAYQLGVTRNVWIVDLAYASEITDLQSLLSGVIHDSTDLPQTILGGTRYSIDDVLKTDPEEFFANVASSLEPYVVAQEVAIKDRGLNQFYVSSEFGMPMPALYKTAFYRGWTASLGDTDLALYRVSPGLQLVMLPAGPQTVLWSYRGPNNGVLGIIVTCVGVLAVVVLQRWRISINRMVSLHQASLRALSESCFVVKIQHVLPVILVGVFIVCVMQKSAFELIDKTPVTIYPTHDQVLESIPVKGQYFIWNYVSSYPRHEQRFSLEISAKSDFSTLISSTTTQLNSIRIVGNFKEGQRYYYRVKLNAPVLGKWSTPRSFMFRRGVIRWLQ